RATAHVFTPGSPRMTSGEPLDSNLPESRETLKILFDETSGFTEQIGALRQKWAVEREILEEQIRKLQVAPARDLLPPQQGEAINREDSNFNRCAYAPKKSLPAPALDDIVDTFRKVRAYEHQLQQHRGLSTQEVVSYICLLNSVDSRVQEA